MTFGPLAHGDTPPPLIHADVLNEWSLCMADIAVYDGPVQEGTQPCNNRKTKPAAYNS